MGEYKKLTFLNVSISKEKVTVFTENWIIGELILLH